MSKSRNNSLNGVKTEFVIASTPAAARRVAAKIAAGAYPRLYASEAAAHEAFATYLSWERKQYRVHSVTVTPNEYRNIPALTEETRARYA
jgi:hypothetical protein